MKSLWHAEARREIVERIEALTPEHKRKWGKMECHQMICHLADQLRMALGEIETEPLQGPLRFTPIRYLVVKVLPWPQGKTEAPREAFTTSPTLWAADRAKLLALIERFGQAAAERLPRTHPLFGRMSCKDWAVLSYRHLDHHLRQFSA
ncbi:DinB family protein [bacterium]|nr:DinB family protein [bacterium]